jgi:predicted MFS family arabinose efflux permease
MVTQRARRRRFLCAVTGMWWIFLSVGILVPLLPGYVARGLDSSSTVVGISVLLYAISGVLSRPIAAVCLRRHTPWTLMTVASAIGSVTLAATPAWHHLGWFYSMRFMEGLAVGVFYTAAASGVVRDTPPASRGSALSYFSVPLFLGIAVGPMAGDQIIEAVGLEQAWVIAGVLMLLAVPTSIWPVLMRVDTGGTDLAAAGPLGDITVPALTKNDLWRAIVHPAAVVPAAIMALAIAGWAGFQAYVPLYGPTIGMKATGSIFLVYAIVVLTIRVGGARLFDVLPLVELVVVGAVANIVGLLVAWFWREPAALHVAAALLAVSVGLMFVTLMRVSLAGAPAHDEPAIVGAYSIAYDVGAGIGASILGVVITTTGSYASAFVGGAAAGVVALGMTLYFLWPARERYRADRLSSQTQ